MLSKFQPNNSCELPIEYIDLLDLNRRYTFFIKHQDLIFQKTGDMMLIKLSQIVPSVHL